MFIVIAGNPVDGFSFYGPYSTHDEACEWGERANGEEWWVAALAMFD